MALRDFLKQIDGLAKANRLSQPFIVGGTPRDRLMEKKVKISDIDLTTGNDDAIKLAGLLAPKFPDSNLRTFDDGHVALNVMGIRVDFSNHFIIPNIQNILMKMGIKDITPMKMELYSRDFTMNTLLEDLELKTIYDLTQNGVEDVKAGIIRCPLDPNITIKSDPRRILRAIKYAIKFDFTIDDKTKDAMLEHRKLIANLPKRFCQERMNEIVRLDNERGLNMLVEFKLLPIVPLTKVIYDTLIQKRQLARAM